MSRIGWVKELVRKAAAYAVSIDKALAEMGVAFSDDTGCCKPQQAVRGYDVVV